MNALGAFEQFAPDARVPHVAVFENGPRDRDRSFGVVGGLGDAPLALRIADVPWDECAWRSLESTDSVRIPAKNPGTRQRLGLLADRVTGCDPVETGDNPLFNCWIHVSKTFNAADFTRR